MNALCHKGLTLGVALTAAPLSGCGAADRVLVDVPVEALPSSAEVTAGDTAVSLTEATITIQDLRMEIPVDTAVAERPEHPGHEASGDVGGELLGAFTLDLLADATELGVAQIYDGPYATASLGLSPEPAGALSGVAHTADGDRPFSFTFDLDGRVEGIPFETTVDREAPPASLSLTVDLGHALSWVDWSTPDDDGDGILTLSDGALANTVPFGVDSTLTWSLTASESL